MYKVAIIDDEPIIVEGLSRVVPWEKYHCQVAGTAGNGQEGLKIIREIRPDMIFSDISMPGMDGLTMIAALRVEFPDMLITILTGFRDFDFAQKAIRLGVSRFLLKPSNMDEIEEALAFMTESLDRRKAGAGANAAGGGNEGASGSAVAGDTGMAGSASASGRAGISGASGAAGAAGSANGATAGDAKSGDGETGDSGDSEKTAGSFLVKNALRYMEEHYRERITLAEVADKIYVSQWHLSKLLNRHTGNSFSELLNHIRIEKAKELLKDPSKRIGDVSEDVGFLDVAHFSRVFKKQEGISANEYRNKRI
ncbi:MAG: response regulator [Hungatella hathewayi]|nr:response regulator [Hungatella hathewayi]